eukprot:7214906-Prorocentrum_lima.AAC.1
MVASTPPRCVSPAAMCLLIPARAAMISLFLAWHREGKRAMIAIYSHLVWHAENKVVRPSAELRD